MNNKKTNAMRITNTRMKPMKTKKLEMIRNIFLMLVLSGLFFSCTKETPTSLRLSFENEKEVIIKEYTTYFLNEGYLLNRGDKDSIFWAYVYPKDNLDFSSYGKILGAEFIKDGQTLNLVKITKNKSKPLYRGDKHFIFSNDEAKLSVYNMCEGKSSIVLETKDRKEFTSFVNKDFIIACN